MNFCNKSIGAFALLGALAMATTGAVAHDESKFPDWSGQWHRPRHGLRCEKHFRVPS